MVWAVLPDSVASTSVAKRMRSTQTIISVSDWAQTPSNVITVILRFTTFTITTANNSKIAFQSKEDHWDHPWMGYKDTLFAPVTSRSQEQKRWPDDLDLDPMTLIFWRCICIPEMNFLGQGFQYFNSLGITNNRQTDVGCGIAIQPGQHVLPHNLYRTSTQCKVLPHILNGIKYKSSWNNQLQVIRIDKPCGAVCTEHTAFHSGHPGQVLTLRESDHFSGGKL